MAANLRGVAFEEAVQRWGAPDLVAELQRALPFMQRPKARLRSGRPTGPGKLDEVCRRADASLLARLYGMQLFCSGRNFRSNFGDQRSIIHPERLNPAHAVYCRHQKTLTCDARLPSERVYSEVEVFAYPPLPANIHTVSSEMREIFAKIDAAQAARLSGPSPEESGYASADSFQVQNDYAQVILGGCEFLLSRAQAAIVRELHAAFLRGEPWIHISELKKTTGMQSQNLSMLFRRQRDPDWKALIASDGRGFYRLKMTR